MTTPHMLPLPAAATASPPRKHSHYFKSVAGLESVDVYRVLHLFNVTDPCLGHAVKKLLVAGGRGGGKDISRDIQEAIDTLERWKDMRAEEAPLPQSCGCDVIPGAGFCPGGGPAPGHHCKARA